MLLKSDPYSDDDSDYDSDSKLERVDGDVDENDDGKHSGDVEMMSEEMLGVVGYAGYFPL